MSGDDVRVHVRVHDKGDDRLDAVIRLHALATRAGTLDQRLQRLCGEVEKILGADVVSVYVRETADEGEMLVMRANVGFPLGAIGRVRLRIGEGITGFVAECLRPASFAAAHQDGHYEHVPGLGEERFPAFAAIPLPVSGRAAGVLVLQRRATLPFAPSEVLLASALAIAFIHVLAQSPAESSPSQRTLSRARGARLEGDPLSGGRAYGRAVFLPSLDVDVPSRDGHARPESVLRSLERVARDVRNMRRKMVLPPDLQRHLAASALLLDDRRFADALVAQVSALGLGAGLRRVARDYARHALRASITDRGAAEWLGDRSEEVEDLCALLRDGASHKTALRRGAVLALPDRLTPLVAIVSAARHVGAIVVGGEIRRDAPGAAVARAANVPCVGHVVGLFAWTRPGDALLVDGTKGIVKVDPSEREVAGLRARAGGPGEKASVSDDE